MTKFELFRDSLNKAEAWLDALRLFALRYP